jgi:hypothetical protein
MMAAQCSLATLCQIHWTSSACFYIGAKLFILMDSFEIVAIFSTLTLFVGYHLHLYVIRPSCLGGSIPFAINLVNSEMWMKKHKEGNDTAAILLAVQTLRNTLMAAIFIGGNAIVIAYNLANEYPSLTDPRLRVRSLVIMTLMFSSFLCWANVIRLASVLGYMIGTMTYSEKLRTDLTVEQRGSGPSDIDDISLSSGVSANADTSTSQKRKKRIRRSKLRVKNHVFTAEAIPDIYEESTKMLKLMIMCFSFGFRLMFGCLCRFRLPFMPLAQLPCILPLHACFCFYHSMITFVIQAPNELFTSKKALS